MNLSKQQNLHKWASILTLLLVLSAIVLRLWVYFQGRDFIIDEANVARNIYEKGFVELLKPLDYEQYAPPIFLWITKLNATLFGFTEWSLTLYPIICGVLVCVFMYKLLQKLVPTAAAWYPLALFAFTPILIRYSSELKQYMPDVFIALLLMWLALRVDIKKVKPIRFFILWSFVGVLAVFSSMPSVFILAGVGAYYGWELIATKSYKLFLPLGLAVCIWLGVFGLYYYLILLHQANSGYLQDFHHYYFLFATPSKAEDWNHNFKVIYGLMYPFEGVKNHINDLKRSFLLNLIDFPAHGFNVVLLVVGMFKLLVKDRPKLFLFMVPVLALFAAACIDKFTLLPRVSLFIMPVFMILIGVGFAHLFSVKNTVLKLVLIGCGIYAVSCNVNLLLSDPFRYEELRQGLKFIKGKDIKQEDVYLYSSSVPAFKYYTEIHPDKEEWAELKGAHFLQWHTNYDSLAWQLQYKQERPTEKAFIYTSIVEKDLRIRDGGVQQHLQRVDSLATPQVKVYVYRKR